MDRHKPHVLPLSWCLGMMALGLACGDPGSGTLSQNTRACLDGEEGCQDPSGANPVQGGGSESGGAGSTGSSEGTGGSGKPCRDSESSVCPVAPPPGPCVVGGCSGEICAEEPAFSICIFPPPGGLPPPGSVCERQESGECGWTAGSCAELDPARDCPADCGVGRDAFGCPVCECGCPGPNPAAGECAADADCPDGTACVMDRAELCTPSACACTEEGWACTPDCNGKRGFCLPPGDVTCLSSEDPSVRSYYEADVCRVALIACPEGTEYFGDECGCGCIDAPGVDAPCVVGGCSGEICAEEPTFSICIFPPPGGLPPPGSVCQRQESGSCGWSIPDDAPVRPRTRD